MSQQNKRLYVFDSFRLDPGKRLLLRDGVSVPLTPKAFLTLLVLVQNSSRVVGKDELMQAVWPDTVVEEGGLTRNISVLRKALGDGSNGNRYIVTVPGQGYSFVAEVKLEPSVSWEEPAGAAANVDETQSENTTAIAEQLQETVRRHKPGLRTALAAGVLAIGAMAFGLYNRFGQPKTTAPSQSMTINRLTTIGKAVTPTISPDGKYVAYTVVEGGQHSLWLRQVATASDVQIVPPDKTWYLGSTFSRDGHYLYYVAKETRETSDAELILYQMPALGGAARKLIVGVSSLITLSPDGNRLAFVRRDPAQDESYVIVDKLDGTGEQRLATRKEPSFFYSVAWSPDGKKIACAGWREDSQVARADVVEVDVNGEGEKSLTVQNWDQIDQLVWLPDGSGLLMTAKEKKDSARQIWRLAYPSGEARRVTQDLNDYSNLSLTADAEALVSIQFNRDSHIWTVPVESPAHARQITKGVNRQDGLHGIAWTPAGKLVYSSLASGKREIWIMEADGTAQRRLTVDSGQTNNLSVSPDGRYIAFVANPTGKFNIWRVNIDGNDARQLTSGEGEFLPYFSPDSQWVIYHTFKASQRVPWKVSVDGGSPTQLAHLPMDTLRISPDGKLAAFFSPSKQPEVKLGIMPSAGGQPIKTLNLPATASRIQWSHDSRALTYIDTRGGVSNIWNQSLDGDAPKQLTDFAAGLIEFFAWSHDGKQLAYTRSSRTTDVVLLRNFK